MGELCVLVDAGLPPRVLRERFAAAGLPHRGLDHLLVTHGHLDHARSAGIVAKQHQATVHCANSLLRARAVARAPRLVALRIGGETELEGSGERARYRAVPIPHDCDPTVAYRIEHRGRALAILTDIGRPDPGVAEALRGVHLLVLEFNHDAELLAAGPYGDALKRRILGDRGHLSNAQAAEMLRRIAAPELHTVVLAHLSAQNNSPELARAAAHEALAEIGRGDVRVVVARQDAVGENLSV